MVRTSPLMIPARERRVKTPDQSSVGLCASLQKCMDKDLQVENGHFTRIANKILDDLVSVDVSSSELRIILAIIRKTYGFQKTEDYISLSQLTEMTHISKRNVVYLIQNLEAKKLLIIGRENETNKIRFNKYSDTWLVQNSAIQVKENRDRAKITSAKLRNTPIASAKLGKTLVQNYVKNVRSFAHTKEKRNIQKKVAQQSSAESISSIIGLFKEVNPSTDRLFGMPPQRAATDRLLVKFGEEKLSDMVRFLPKSNASRYAPTITTPVQLERDLGKLIAWGEKEKDIKKGRGFVTY